MKSKDIINKTPADLARLLAEKRETLRTVRFSAAAPRSKNVKEGREIRKDIARILTAMNAIKA